MWPGLDQVPSPIDKFRQVHQRALLGRHVVSTLHTDQPTADQRLENFCKCRQDYCIPVVFHNIPRTTFVNWSRIRYLPLSRSALHYATSCVARLFFVPHPIDLNQILLWYSDRIFYDFWKKVLTTSIWPGNHGFMNKKKIFSKPRLAENKIF